MKSSDIVRVADIMPQLRGGRDVAVVSSAYLELG